MAQDDAGRNAKGTDTPAGHARDDDQEALERALRRHGKDEGLAGQIEDNINLTGSTTYETLPGQPNDRVQHARKGQAESPRELNHNEQPKKKEGHH